MARTAPTINGTPTYLTVSFRWIDASGDVRADSLQLPATTTDAQIEAIVAALAAISNASLYAVVVGQQYNSVADKSDAVDAPKDSVFDNFAILAKTALNESRRVFLPAPEGATFVAGTDQVDPTNADIATLFAAILAPLGVTYDIVSIRYTERREINEAVKI